MIRTLVPTSKMGTPFQSPSWRYQAITYPERFGLDGLCSKRIVDAGHLSRLIPKGVPPAQAYTLPLYFRKLRDQLPEHLAEVLTKTWNKHYFANHTRKASFGSVVSNSVPICWKVNEVKKLNDPFLVRLLLHSVNYAVDRDIQEAIKFYKDPDNDVTKGWFRYSIYAGHTDAQLAKKWKKSLKFIEAVRLAFFDYSEWPKDRLVQFALLKTLERNGELDPADFHVHRRIFDLGDTGLRSVFDCSKLTDQEKQDVKLYLESCPVDELLNLKYSIRTSKDAHAFHKAVAEYANVSIKRLEIEQRAELLRLSAAKLSKEMGMNQEAVVFAEDKILMTEMEELKRFDHVPKFPSFIDVRAEAQKLIVEKTE